VKKGGLHVILVRSVTSAPPSVVPVPGSQSCPSARAHRWVMSGCRPTPYFNLTYASTDGRSPVARPGYTKGKGATMMQFGQCTIDECRIQHRRIETVC